MILAVNGQWPLENELTRGIGRGRAASLMRAGFALRGPLPDISRFTSFMIRWVKFALWSGSPCKRLLETRSRSDWKFRLLSVAFLGIFSTARE